MSPPKMLVPYGDDFLQSIDFFVRGRGALAMVMSAFFDESYDEQVYCVAGYLFVNSRLKKLDVAWRSLLLTYKVRYFRMSECAHGNGEFSKLSKPQRVDIARKAIEIIKAHAALGIAATVSQTDFDMVVKKNDFINSPYELCTWACMVEAAIWANEHRTNPGIAYVFEAGESHEGSALCLLNKVISQSYLKDQYKVSSVMSIAKFDSRPCQAADLWAWQWRKQYGRQSANLPIRKDLRSLLEAPHTALHIDSLSLQRLFARIEAGVGPNGEVPRAWFSAPGRPS